MGADITFSRGKESFYFRDAYNSTNLAWIVGLSYWQDGKTKKQRIEFFEKLAELSDEQLKAKVDEFHRDPKACNIEPDRERWLKMFKEKRNDVRKHLPFIRRATRIVWSV